MPPKGVIENPYLDKDSLLGREEIRQVFSCLDQQVYLGIKVHNPIKDKSLENSVGLNFATLKALQAAV